MRPTFDSEWLINIYVFSAEIKTLYRVFSNEAIIQLFKEYEIITQVVGCKR